MQFLVKAYDAPGALGKRLEVRPAHLEGMKKLGGRVVCAGGLLDGGENMKGSVLILDFPDRAALDGYLAAEPYVTGGVWEKIEVEQVNVVISRGETLPK